MRQLDRPEGGLGLLHGRGLGADLLGRGLRVLRHREQGGLRRIERPPRRLELLVGGLGARLRFVGLLALLRRRIEVALRERLQCRDAPRIARQPRVRGRGLLAQLVLGPVVRGDLADLVGGGAVAGHEGVRRDRGGAGPQVLLPVGPQRAHRRGGVGRADLAERVEDRGVLRRPGRLVEVVRRRRGPLQRREQLRHRARIVEPAERGGRVEVHRRDRLARGIAAVAAVPIELPGAEQLAHRGVLAAQDLAELAGGPRTARDERAPDLRVQLREPVHREQELAGGGLGAQLGEGVDRRAGHHEGQLEALDDLGPLLLVRLARVRRWLAIDDLHEGRGRARLVVGELAERADRGDLCGDELPGHRPVRELDQRRRAGRKPRLSDRVRRLVRAVDGARVRRVDLGDRRDPPGHLVVGGRARRGGGRDGGRDHHRSLRSRLRCRGTARDEHHEPRERASDHPRNLPLTAASSPESAGSSLTHRRACRIVSPR